MDFQNQGKIALLIDAENTNSKKIDLIINSVSIQGYIITKRAYGNWTKLGKDWESAVKENAIETIQQFSNTKEKNSSDIALVIDAMDLMYSKKYDTIALVSSDSDFTKLIIRIHNEGLRVLGFGEKKTPISLIKACDEFTYIEDLTDSNENEEKSENLENSEKTVNEKIKISRNEKIKLIKTLREISDLGKYTDEDGCVNIGCVGTILKRQDSTFSASKYGYSSLVKLIKNELDKSVEIKTFLNEQGRLITTKYRMKEQEK